MNRSARTIAPRWALCACAAAFVGGCGRTPPPSGSQHALDDGAPSPHGRIALAASPIASARPATRARLLDGARARVGATGAAPVDVGGQQRDTSSDATLVSIAVTGGMPSLPMGLSEQMVALGSYDDGSVEDLTDLVTWASANDAIASLATDEGQAGLLTGQSPGVVALTATMPSGVKGTAEVKVVDAIVTQVWLTPIHAFVPSGLGRQINAIGHFSDGHDYDVTPAMLWHSSDEKVAVIDDSGVVKAKAQGNVIIGAVVGGVTASAQLSVVPSVMTGIVVSPAGPPLPAGRSRKLSAAAIYSDGSQQDATALCTWSTSCPESADVSDAGVVSAIAPGEADVSCAVGGLIGTVSLVVTDPELVALTIGPGKASVPVDGTVQLHALGLYSDGSQADLTGVVDWSSSDASIATVGDGDDDKGLATGVLPGAVDVVARLLGVTSSAHLTVGAAVLVKVIVSVPPFTLHVGDSAALVARGIYGDGSQADVTAQASWASADPGVLSVAQGDQGVVVTAVGGGTTQVSATVGGLVGASSMGVSAAALSGLFVSGPEGPLQAGGAAQLHAMASYDDGSSSDVTARAVWSSSDEAVAKVSNAAGAAGSVAAVGSGQAMIAATFGAQGAKMLVMVQ